MDEDGEARSSSDNHRETRLPAPLLGHRFATRLRLGGYASTWCLVREGMHLTYTIQSQLLRRQDAASPSEGAAQRCSPLGDAASCRVSLVHGPRRNVPEIYLPFATPEAYPPSAKRESRSDALAGVLEAASPSEGSMPWRQLMDAVGEAQSNNESHWSDERDVVA